MEMKRFEDIRWIHGGYTDLNGSGGGSLKNIRKPRFSAVCMVGGDGLEPPTLSV